MEMCNIWTTLAQAVALSLAGEADARLKCSVNARRRDTDTGERQKNKTIDAKTHGRCLTRSGEEFAEPQVGLTIDAVISRSLLEMVILAFR